MKNIILKIFKYIEPLWLGSNNKLSIRRTLALAFSIDLISNMSFAIHKWEIGKSYAELSSALLIEAGLIAACLSLTTYSAIVNKKIDSTSTNPTQPADI